MQSQFLYEFIDAPHSEQEPGNVRKNLIVSASRSKQELLAMHARGGHNDSWRNESTAGADASGEIPKLHNIIAFIHMMNIFALINFAACKLKEWVMIDHDCC